MSRQTPQDQKPEKEEDMFVLIDRSLPITGEAKLVSSRDDAAAGTTGERNNGKDAKERNGWERVPVFGRKAPERSEK